MLFDGVGQLAEFDIGKRAARIARIRFQKFDRHLALHARTLGMGGLATDVADQTCKTASQSRTRFVGHRQLPWIHALYSELNNRIDDLGSPMSVIARSSCDESNPVFSL